MKFSEIKYLAHRLNAEGGKKKFVGFTKVFAFVSIMLGSAALIIALSVLDGFENELRNTAVKFTSHITIKGFESRPVIEYRSLIERIKTKFPEIASATPSIQKEALIRGKKGIEGVMLKGIKYVPSNIAPQPFNINDNIIKGDIALNSNSIILGKSLAEKISADIDSKVLIYNMDFQGSMNFNPKYKQFIVTGIYETGMMQYDDNLAFISFDEAGKLNEYEDNIATTIDVMLKDFRTAPELSFAMDDELGFPYFTMTVFDLHSAIFAWIELQKQPIPLVLGLITLVAVLNIITSILVLIVEKTYTIGILRSLGINNRDLLKVFIWKGMKIGVYGSIAGSFIAFVLLYAQKQFEIIRLKGEIYFLTVAPVDISLWHYQLVIGTAIILTFLVTLIPALITLKISPLRAIRFR